MAKISFDGKGVAEWIDKLAAMGQNASAASGKALYDAAKIYADELRRQTEALPVENGLAKEGSFIHVLSAAQKEALLNSIDIYTVKPSKNGKKAKSVGFVGYNEICTSKYPRGQPNRMIAASVNSGSSVRAKDPFVRRAQKATHDRCVQAMKDAVDAEFNKIIK